MKLFSLIRVGASSIVGLSLCLVAVIFFPASPVYATTNITTCSQLQDINNDLTGDYVLSNDIDCSGISNFVPFGTEASNFTGTFDGQGYAISNLTISYSGTAYVGLFSWTGVGSVVRNVGIVDAEILGSSYSGSLVGKQNGGSIDHVYASGGSVSCPSAAYCGGLIGYMGDPGATVTSSYTNIDVSGDTYMGGVVGRFATGTISNVYAVGSAQYGIIGSVDGGVTPDITGSYYDQTTTGASDNTFGTPKTTAQMMVSSTFSGWDFTVAGDGTVGDWIMAGYPHLQMEHRSTITTLTELQLMAVDLTDDYTLANDINATSTTNWNSGAGFDSIGTLTGSAYFTGTFDGQDFSISNLYVNRPTRTWVGLFGFLHSSSIVSDLTLVNGNITGNGAVGGLAGRTDGDVSQVSFTGTVYGNSVVGGLIGEHKGNITNSYATGTVDGTTYVGGLTGYSDGDITNSYANADVSGTTRVGGLSGTNYSGSIVNCYSLSSVSGDNQVGGLIGDNSSGTITNSYAAGSVVSAGDAVGGLVGSDATGVITNSFYDGAVSGQSDTGKGVSKTTAEMKMLATFTDTDTAGLASAWDFVGTPYDDAGTSSYWEMDPAINSGYPYLAWQQSDTNAPSAPSSVASSVSGSNVTLSWSNPTAGDFISITARRSSSGYPSSVSNGSAVLSATTTTSVAETSLADGTYYYSIFALDNTGNVSLAGTLLVTIESSSGGGNGGGGGIIILPPGSGSGSRDASTFMNKTVDIGEITTAGVNLLAYIESRAVFHLSDGENHTLAITDVDLSLHKQVTFIIASEPQTITLDLGHSALVDVDGDGVNDMSILFADVWVSRVELTMRALSSDSADITETPREDTIVPTQEDSVQCTPFVLSRTLAQGMSGSDVLTLQVYLNTHNAILATEGPGSVGNETTYFGTLTRTAVKVFQRTHNLVQSGTVDTATRAHLGCAGTLPVVTQTVASSFTRDLSLGMSGADVRALQVYLNTHGFPVASSGPGSSGEETVYFGEKTNAAVIRFQTARGIVPAVGYVGGATRGAL